MRRPIIWIMVGLVGSGKSTWARKQVGKNLLYPTCIICRDALRLMSKGSYEYEKQNEILIRHMKKSCIRSALSLNYNMVIDECHINIDARKKTLQDIWEACRGTTLIPRIRYVWCTESNNNLERRSNDLRGYTQEYWDGVIKGMIASFQEPSLNEGLDKLSIERIITWAF